MLSRLVLLAVLCTSYAVATPTYMKHATHRTRSVGRRGLQLESYYPPNKYETGGSASKIAGRAEEFDASDFKKSTMNFVQSHLNVSASGLSWKAGYTVNDRQYGYARQEHDGIPFANAVANVVLKNGRMASFGSSFVDTSNIADSKPTHDLQEAVKNAEDAMSGTHDGFEPSIEYLARPDGSVALTYVIQVRNDHEGTYYEVFVDAHNGEVLSANNFVAHASYKAIPIERPDLRSGYEFIKDPEDLTASPLGWHNDGTENYTSTSGNNIVVVTNHTNTFTLTNETAPGLIFNYTYDDSISPHEGENVDASRTQAFYLGNKVHDLLYRYGFTEDAFNFQVENFGKGGVGGDPVLMVVQSEDGMNNAGFVTLPDGQPGLCLMYLWNRTEVHRDGVFDTVIPVHEFVHGLTNRMTGGGTGRCLQSLESSGLGEGWSDAVAEWTRQTDGEVKDFVAGAYVSGKPEGIRTYPYSTDPEVNPLRYSSVKEMDEEHDIGEVWANILHNVYAALVKEHGWSASAWTDPTGKEGNVLFLQLLINALALQPCNPTFVDARDAWIEADEDEYDGANKCLLWRAFASRGLGMKAHDYEDDETIPQECQTNY
uniref:Extracellular metalloproteinase n=2 Tax=Moniliophthora roreri TaxID=221103 RepID=A0A0W0FV15_MONRR